VSEGDRRVKNGGKMGKEGLKEVRYG